MPASPRIIDTPPRSARLWVLLVALIPWCGGCISLTPYPKQAPVRDMVEPTTGRAYLLYVPSIYTERRTWPLVVACHGTVPFDTAGRQMSEWAQFGEEKGILIVSPSLEAARGDFPPGPDEQIARQSRDERAILGIVAATRNAYRIADEQIFMTGWSAAAYDILYSGLRNPEVFRALAIRQGNFDPRFLDPSEYRVDRWQPVKVIYGNVDYLREQSLACIKWLREHGHYVESLEIAGSHRRTEPSAVWDFFRDVVKNRPWIHIESTVSDPARPLARRFAVRSVPPVRRVKWFFGDGADSHDLAPEHVYAEGGDFEVSANVELVGGRKFSRRRIVRVVVSPAESDLSR